MPRSHAASAPPGRLSRRHRAWVFGAAGALLASGVLWLAIHYGTPGDEFGGRSPLEAWCLRIHGLATMVFLVVVGSLLPGHVERGWGARRNWRTGSGMIATVAVLAATGYMLYYAGDETLRPWIGILHWGLGLVAAPLLAWHILGARRRPARHVRLAHGRVARLDAAPHLPQKGR